VCVIASCDLFPKDPEPEPEESNQSQPSNPSNPSAPQAPGSPSSPAQTLSVTISGTGDVGKEMTANVTKNFTGTPTYQWLVDGQNIPGETSDEYTPFITDSGKKISVKVSGYNKTFTSSGILVTANMLQ
jgi:hypothetical protein